jgi:Skp family chaperone for outer membrane proteins
MLLRFLALSLVMAAFVSAARAETCKYMDAEGRVIYSNTATSPPKGAKKIRCFDDPTPKTAQKPAPNSDAARKEAFPRVDERTQRKRDDDRRQILQRELAEEQNRLAEAQRKLAEAESLREGGERNYQRVLDRLKPFQDAVASHERNIESIQRELSTQK